MPAATESAYSPELQRLLLLIESDLHFIVRMDLSREQALDIKGRFARPLGVLNSRFDLRSDRDAKNGARNDVRKD